MKKQLMLLALLLIVVFSIFNFAFRILVQPANATYVEGPITQDTFWMLANSPFIVSNNVTVYPNATLIIEPGVIVKFGEDTALIVNGKIVANGTTDKGILFTSNRLTPAKGDWGTILIDGAQPSSLLYCTIEWSINGITIDGGSLNVQNSFVESNSGNGIHINNGVVTVRNNEIANNDMSGVYITDGTQIIIKNNIISSNGEGISLTGHLVGNIDIEQNNVSLNEQSGIGLTADAYDNTIIINNNVSANFNGFRVSTDVSTYITRNYISDNAIGIYYDSGNNHEAHFNDIYDNVLGMEVSSTATVDATYNYWGHQSGPFHEMLNPHGKGNRVGGNGVNLDFIFFLSAPIDYSNTVPTALLWTDKILVAPDQNVNFVGADSHDDGRVDQYFFDFGDGTNSSWTTLSVCNHTYSSIGTHIASLRVIDDFNVTSTNIATVTISVQNIAALNVLTTLSSYTIFYNGAVSVTVYVSNGTSALESVNVTLFSVNGGNFDSTSGLTNSTGYFTATFTAPNATEVTNVMIIARASISGYANGADYKYLEVIPPLKVQVTTETGKIKSGDTAIATVDVTDHFDKPVSDALLELSVDYGTLSSTMGVTGADGKATFNFLAPQTPTQISATITVTAKKLGSADGSGQTVIIVEPKILVVEITAEPKVTISEANISVTVQVSYDAAPIPDANVTVTFGTLPVVTELTDFYGYTTFVFAAPQANTPVNVTITAHASKIGYTDGENTSIITVYPGTLNVAVTAEPSTIMSRESTAVTVVVACNETAVANVSITISADDGSFPETIGFTDSNGYCTFTFDAPRITGQQSFIVITANATKNGYVSGVNQTTITVAPEAAGGFPLTTLLLIIIPVVIVIIIVVLVKLKVIGVSTDEEME
jgi:parallel beta-helix repeat protein